MSYPPALPTAALGQRTGDQLGGPYHADLCSQRRTARGEAWKPVAGIGQAGAAPGAVRVGLQSCIQAQHRADLREVNSKWMIVLVSAGRKGSGLGI